MSLDPQISALATAFVSQLRATLTADQMRQIADENAALSPADRIAICASGDFCDSNECMSAAFVSVMGREIDAASDADSALWNAAWAFAKEHLLTRIGLALSAAGFTLEWQGGGVFNWRKPVGSGLEYFCCDDDGAPPKDHEPATFGICLVEGGDVLCDKTFASGLELARAIQPRT